MATLTQTTLVDDIDGGPATESIRFTLGLDSYQIDLNDDNAAELRKTFSRYTTYATKLPRTARTALTGQARRVPTVVDREQTKAIRDWARTNGYTVSERGRIPGQVIAAYNDRNANAAPVVVEQQPVTDTFQAEVPAFMAG